jgi:hypothetical protein
MNTNILPENHDLIYDMYINKRLAITTISRELGTKYKSLRSYIISKFSTRLNNDELFDKSKEEIIRLYVEERRKHYEI